MKRRSTDTVDAKLTPREAVLNRNAAELLGRDTIKRLNDHGNMLSRRGVDLASDPTPGPSTENLLGYQMGTADVRRDDRADLLRDAENTFYGGGNAPAPTPTPTPKPRGYQYGTDDVTDQRKNNAASRYNRHWDVNPISTSQYIGKGGTLLGPQYDPQTAAVNPLPGGAVGIQGFSQPQSFGAASKPMTHTEMAADIARRNLTSSGSLLGTPQRTVGGINASTLEDQGIDPNQSMANVNFNTLRNIQDNKDRQAGTHQSPQNEGYGSAYVSGYSSSDVGQSGVTTEELNNAGIRPGRYADAASPIMRSGTGFSYTAGSGSKVDIAGPMHFTKVRAAVERRENQGY